MLFYRLLAVADIAALAMSMFSIPVITNVLRPSQISTDPPRGVGHEALGQNWPSYKLDVC